MSASPLGVPRIAFNALLLSPTGDHREAGIHRYISALLEALSRIEGVDILAFTSTPEAAKTVPAPFQAHVAPAWAKRRMGRVLWEQLSLPKQLRRQRCSLLHAAAFAMPRHCPVPAVVTIHDLSFFRHPEAFPRRQGAYLRAATRHAARNATALVTISEFTKRELVELVGVPSERVHAVPCGLEPRFHLRSPAELDSWRAARDLPPRFVLTVGTLQPRKNLRTLLEAYTVWRSNWRGPGTMPALVVAGAPGWGPEDPQEVARSLGIAPDVHWLGYVPSADLPWLYGAAEVFALPSRYEGFGLPALEAMGCGTPVVASRAASMPEVIGEAGVLIDPDDVNSWAMALADLSADEARRHALQAAGIQRAARFSWDRAALATTEVWRQAASGATERPADASALSSRHQPVATPDDGAEPHFGGRPPGRTR